MVHVLSLSRARRTALAIALVLAAVGASRAAAQCPFGSIQSRVQPNISTPWTQTLTIELGQAFRVGGFYNGTGLLDTTGNVQLQLTGPSYSSAPTNGSYVTVPYAGSYTLRAYCGTLNDYAYITVNAASSGTNAKRFIYGMGVAWGSQWPQLTTDTARKNWDRANLDQIVAAGATNTHVSFDWIGIETSRGVYDWSYADHQVVEAEKRGLEMFAYTGNTPNWALASRLANPSLPVCAGKPNNPLLPPGETTQGIADFQNFHRTLAQRYCGRVKHYEFWNEPNGCWWMSCGCGDQSDAQKAEYARWLQRWYSAMKQGCADVVLSVGGLDCNWGGDPNSAAPWCIDWMSKLYDNGGGNSFDAVALHPYGYGGDLQVTLQQNKGLNWTVINGVTNLLAQKGHSSKKLWLDEWGFNTPDDNIKGQLVGSVLNTLATQYPNVFQARYLTITDLPDGSPWGLADSNTASYTVTPRGSWSAFRAKPLGANTQRLPLWNPGMEYQGQPPSAQYTSPIPNWGPNGAWAFHLQYARTGNGVLGRKFGYYSAGLAETFGQVLSATFQPNRTYRFKASVQGGGDNTGTLQMQIGYQSTTGVFTPLTTTGATVLVPLGASWVDTSGAYYTTPASGGPIGRPIWVRFGTGGAGDVWFDNLLVTVNPPQ